jgi:hypothetical protein
MAEREQQSTKILEQWLEIRPETKEALNKKLKEVNPKISVEAKDGFFVESGSQREKQLTLCFTYAQGRMVADRVNAGQGITQIPTIGTATLPNIDINGVNVTLMLLLRAKQDRFNEEDIYKSERAQLLDNVNEILDTFDEPLLPQYSSRDKIKV